MDSDGGGDGGSDGGGGADGGGGDRGCEGGRGADGRETAVRGRAVREVLRPFSSKASARLAELSQGLPILAERS
jgi:hypothetical protein